METESLARKMELTSLQGRVGDDCLAKQRGTRAERLGAGEWKGRLVWLVERGTGGGGAGRGRGGARGGRGRGRKESKGQ
mgnify:CR=1 FL=1